MKLLFHSPRLNNIICHIPDCQIILQQKQDQQWSVYQDKMNSSNYYLDMRTSIRTEDCSGHLQFF